MRRVIIPALIALLATPAFAAEAPKTEDQKTLYSVGQIMARQLSYFHLSAAELELVQQGLADAILGKAPQVDVDMYRKKAEGLAAARRDEQGKKLAIVAKDFVEKAAKEKGTVKTESGMLYQSLKEGSGESPTVMDSVKVNYRGTLVDGQEFDSNAQRGGKPAEFMVNRVIKCFSEGLQMMKPGGKAKFVCPPELAYAGESSGLVPPNATLAYEVELLSVKKQGPEEYKDMDKSKNKSLGGLPPTHGK